MLIKFIETLFLLILALVWDTRYCRIDNRITIGFAAGGMITNLVFGGLGGLFSSLIGWILPVAILFLFYALKMLGAGDLKLFGAIGAIWGAGFAIDCMAYSFLIGGAMGLLFLAVRKNTRHRLKYLFEYLKSCFYTRRLQQYTEFLNKEDKGTFRFSYAIVPAAVIEIVLMTMRGFGGV